MWRPFSHFHPNSATAGLPASGPPPVAGSISRHFRPKLHFGVSQHRLPVISLCGIPLLIRRSHRIGSRGWSAPTPAAQAMIRDDDLAWMRPIRDSPAPADPSDGNVQQAVRCGILRLSPPLPHTRGPRGADSHASYAPTVSARFTDALFACVCVVGVSRDAQGRRAAPAAGGEQRLRAAARGARSRHRVGGRKDRTGDLVSPVPACLL